MIGLITVARHSYLAQQIVQMFIAIKKLLPLLHQHRINIDTVKNVHTSRTFSSDLTLKIFL